MHPMAFLQKRAHLCAVARGREMFARVEDVTPARFDILHLIHEQMLDVVSGIRSNIIAQARVTQLLGLRRQTVWKMVERLIELGLVKKTKDVTGPDKRRNILSLTEAGVRRVHEAYGAAFTERLPLPSAAPTEGDVPRFWRRPELADVRRTLLGDLVPPPKEGREVAKIYTSFAWKLVGGRKPNRRYRYLAFLDQLMMTTRAIAEALGDTSTPIYPMREPEFTGLPKASRNTEALSDQHATRGCEVARVHVRARRCSDTVAQAIGGRSAVGRVPPRRKCRWPRKRRCALVQTRAPDGTPSAEAGPAIVRSSS